MFFQTCLGVFQGGGCRAAAFAGAYEAAAAHDVVFAEVAGTSAGAIVAALIGAGAAPSHLRGVVEQMNFTSLLRPAVAGVASGFPRPVEWLLRRMQKSAIPSLLLRQGMHSSEGIEEWLEEQLRVLLPDVRSPVRFGDLHIPTWIVAADLRTRRVKVWSQERGVDAEVAKAVRASCSIPLFFQPVDGRYVDGGTLSNLPTFVFSSRRPLARRVLAFSLQADAEESPISTTYNTFKAVMNTVVDGAEDLQLATESPNVHVVPIPTSGVKATDFDSMDSRVVRQLVENGAKATHDFFTNEIANVHRPLPHQNQLLGVDEAYTAIVEHLDRPTREILIAERSTRWAYSLFPALLEWRVKEVPVRVILPQGAFEPKSGESYRRRLLRELGATICEVDAVPLRAYIFDAYDADSATALVLQEWPENEAVRYRAPLDREVIASLATRVLGVCSEWTSNPAEPPRLERGAWEELVARLRKVRQYADSRVSLTPELVPLAKMVSLTGKVREFKYRQADAMAELFRARGLELFEPAYVRLPGGKQSIVTPPVLEEMGDRFHIIEGSSRIAYCRRSHIEAIRCVVVRGVREELPATPQPLELVQVVGNTLDVRERYQDFAHELFRDIEARVHQTSDLT
jgi:predicted acylesterase/phospholipase RssA